MKGVDFILLGSVIFLLVIGNTILFGVGPQFFPLQFFYAALALFVFFLASRLDSTVINAFTPLFYGMILVLLVITLVLGIVSHGALRWLPVGPVTLQPSEFAKPIIVLVTARILAKKTSNGFLLSLLFLLPLVFLVFIQPDLGTAGMLVAAWFGAVLAAGVDLKIIFRFFLLVVLLIPLGWFLLAPYQKERLTSFLAPGADPAGASYQARQAQITAGSGGIFGRGLGQGSQTQLAFLPARQTDFIFASIGEELGFVGMGLVAVSFFVLFSRILKMFTHTQGIFSKAAIGGIFLYLFVQVFVNIAMNLGMLPVVGIPLPLISAGGSALVSAMLGLGLIVALRK